MAIKLKISKNKGQESASIEGGFLSGVTGKVILKTPFGKREILPNGKLKK
jgi:hypothetical protein